MGNAFNKEVLRSIVRSAGRFTAIAIISLLGAGFYAGLRMAAPDMRIAGDEFFDGACLYDISVVTTLGLDDESVSLLRGVEGVGAVMPAYRADAMVRVGEGSYAACIESLPLQAARESDTSDGLNALSSDEAYLNRPILLEGTWPRSDVAQAASTTGECVVAASAAKELGISLGDILTVEEVASGESVLEGSIGGLGGLAGSDAAGNVSDTFALTKFKVVGFVNSAAYASSSMLGTTSLGNGSVEMYLYVAPEAFASSLPYSVAYLSVPSAKPCLWGSPEYNEAVAAVKGRVEQVAPALADERVEAVKDELHSEFAGVLYEMTVSLDWANEIDRPEVFVLDRSKNPGVASLDSDADGITQIATFLPFMFFLVAALVSLTSMTRMVDEERLEIGTHKALGYGKARITSKYLVYGVLASGLGSLIGVLTLGKLLPWFILTSYQVSYAIPTAPTPIDFAVAARAIGLSIGITAVATWGAAASTLKAKPAELMLPRAPKAGKRIVLEHIPALWRRMSFSQKVTARNLLRYKRRFFMAIVGVAGCTALLMVGFGLRDAIGGIVANQYEVLVNYDAAVRMDEGISQEKRRAVEKALVDEGVGDYLLVDDFSMVAKGPDGDMRVEVVVPDNPSLLPEFVTMRDRVSGEALSPRDDAIVLTEKAARVLGVGADGQVELYDENEVGDATGDARAFAVEGSAENYLGHFAYMTPEGYHAAFDKRPKPNLVYVKLPEGMDEAAFGDRLLTVDGVSTVSFVSDEIGTYEDMLDVMNKLIYVIMLLSAALAFVVLYNLTNINIGERIREIATLKVLGFTRREVNAYIFREVMVMSLVGATAGCVLGVPLTFYIAEAAETANMMFGRSIEPASFVMAFALTMAFAVIVAVTMRGKLARVNMVESLKSVE